MSPKFPFLLGETHPPFSTSSCFPHGAVTKRQEAVAEEVLQKLANVEGFSLGETLDGLPSP